MIYGLHILRGIAALLVLIYHIYYVSKIYVDYSVSFFEFLYVGVDIFFVISGFIMFYICSRTMENPVCRSEFSRDRFLRVVPLYWIVTLFFFVSNNLIYPEGHEKNIELVRLVFSMLFIPFSDGNGGVSSPVLGVGWTLNYEILFYFSIYLALALKSKAFVFVNAMFIAFVLSGFWIDSEAHVFLSFLSNPIVLEFSFGILLGLFFLEKRAMLLPASLVFLVLSLCSWLIDKKIGFAFEYYRVFVWGTFSAFLVGMILWLEKISVFKSLVSYRVFYLFGSTSYVMYLVHHPILSFLGKAYSRFFGFSSVFVFYVICVFVVYLVTYVCDSFYDRHMKERIRGVVCYCWQ